MTSRLRGTGRRGRHRRDARGRLPRHRRAGLRDTLPVTMDDMIHHANAVDARAALARWSSATCRSCRTRSSLEQAVRERRALREGRRRGRGEARGRRARRRRLCGAWSDAGIPVMGHLGLTPQSVSRSAATRCRRDGEAGARSGCCARRRRSRPRAAFAIVLEGIPAEAGRDRSRASSPSRRSASAPAPYCDGQVLVIYDMLGLTKNSSRGSCGATRSLPRKCAKRRAAISPTCAAAASRRKKKVIKRGRTPLTFLRPTLDMVIARSPARFLCGMTRQSLRLGVRSDNRNLSPSRNPPRRIASAA